MRTQALATLLSIAKLSARVPREKYGRTGRESVQNRRQSWWQLLFSLQEMRGLKKTTQSNLSLSPPVPALARRTTRTRRIIRLTLCLQSICKTTSCLHQKDFRAESVIRGYCEFLYR